MWELWRICCHLDLDSAKLLALVSSRLHYCNSLLYGITDIDLTRLQHVQNQLSWVMIMFPPNSHSLPLLRFLQWLSLRFGILFKINLLTYKTLSKKQPVHLHSMLVASLPSRSLRSSSNNSHSVPRDKAITGARAFHSCTPSLWNNLSLPVYSAISVVNSKKRLKKHLFDLAFTP